MYATKRKFNSLLNNLTSSPSSSLPSNKQPNKLPSTNLETGETDSRAKKRRGLGPAAAYIEATSTPSKLSLSSIRSNALINSSAARTTPHSENTEIKVPNYTPWDRTKFLERLETFKNPSEWCSKPSRIDEVQWAKGGWSCIGEERVRCKGGCEMELFLGVTDQDAEGVKDKSL